MRNRTTYKSYDSSLRRYVRHLLVLIALVMVQALISLTASAESNGKFYAKNMARCFYCDVNTEITPSATLMPEPTPETTVPDTSLLAKQEPEVPVIDTAPAPYKNMVKAYESGDLKGAYDYAEQWVRYQERLAKRTKDLSALMIKAQRMRKQAGGQTVSASLKLKPSQRLQVLYFFDLYSRPSERASKEVQYVYELTLTDPRIELSSWAIGTPSDEELMTYQDQLDYRVPLHRASYLAEKFDVSHTPTVLVLNERGQNVCRHEDYIDSDTLMAFINKCAQTQLNGGGV